MATTQDNLTADAEFNRFVDEYTRERDELRERICDANRDRVLFTDGDQLSIDYDEAEDILLVWSGEPVEAATESVDGFMYVRVHPETLSVVGMEFLSFRARLNAPGCQPNRLHRLLDRIISEYGPGTHRLADRDAPAVADAAREMVFT